MKKILALIASILFGAFIFLFLFASYAQAVERKEYTLTLRVIEVRNPDDVKVLFERMTKQKVKKGSYLHGFALPDGDVCLIVIPHAFTHAQYKEFFFQVAGHELNHCFGYKFHE